MNICEKHLHIIVNTNSKNNRVRYRLPSLQIGVLHTVTVARCFAVLSELWSKNNNAETHI